jgi:hypothetical protein
MPRIYMYVCGITRRNISDILVSELTVFRRFHSQLNLDSAMLSDFGPSDIQNIAVLNIPGQSGSSIRQLFCLT